jgi:hypothetical protein
MQEDTDLAESFEGEEGETTDFLFQEDGGPQFLTFFLHGNIVLVSVQDKLGKFD